MIFRDRFYTVKLTPPTLMVHPCSLKTESKRAQQNNIYLMYERGRPQAGSKPPLLWGGMEMCLQARCFWNTHTGLNPKFPQEGRQRAAPTRACPARRVGCALNEGWWAKFVMMLKVLWKTNMTAFFFPSTSKDLHLLPTVILPCNHFSINEAAECLQIIILQFLMP